MTTGRTVTGAYEVIPAAGPVRGLFRVPPSKSLTHRVFVLGALARGRTRLVDPLLSDDTLRTLRALAAMGVSIEASGPGAEIVREALGGSTDIPSLLARSNTSGSGSAGEDDPAQRDRPGLESDRLVLEIDGRGAHVGASDLSAGGLRAPTGPLDLGASGTSLRLLAAVAALAEGATTLVGDRRLGERPIEPLLEALRSIGIEASRPPGSDQGLVRVSGGRSFGGAVRISGAESSQFASGLLLIAPWADRPMSIAISPPIVSFPYLAMTLGAMERFDAVPTSLEGVTRTDRGLLAPVPEREVRIAFAPSTGYSAAALEVPPDASSASYLFAAAALTGGRVVVRGLHRDDAHPDMVLLAHLERMGCTVEESPDGVAVAGPPPRVSEAGNRRLGFAGTLAPFAVNLAQAPDLVPTMAVLAAFTTGPCAIEGVASLRHKESDRIRALANELGRLGASVEERPDGLRIVPRPLHGGRVETYADHRIAMSLAIAGLVVPGVVVSDPGCVTKSFPGFWVALTRMSRSA